MCEIKFIQRRGKTLLQVQIDPVEESFLWFGYLIETVPSSFLNESPIQLFTNFSIHYANCAPFEFLWAVCSNASKNARRLRTDAIFLKRRIKRNVSLST